MLSESSTEKNPLLTPRAAPLELKPKTTKKMQNPTPYRWYIMTFFALITTTYALYFILAFPTEGNHVKKRLAASYSGWFHLLGSLVAIATGPFQFLILFNRQKRVIHRWLGRVYMGSIAAGGIGGFAISFDSTAYPIGDYGFALLAVVWLVTAAFGLLTARRGDIGSHREWMMRNFASTYAAVMLRWQVMSLLVLGFKIESAIIIAAFSCWVPNLVFTEWWIRKKERRDDK